MQYECQASLFYWCYVSTGSHFLNGVVLEQETHGVFATFEHIMHGNLSCSCKSVVCIHPIPLPFKEQQSPARYVSALDLFEKTVITKTSTKLAILVKITWIEEGMSFGEIPHVQLGNPKTCFLLRRENDREITKTERNG
jgi:hypothetical protein